MTIDSLEGFLSGGGAPSAKFTDVGATVKGTVTSFEMGQATDFDGKPMVWPSGDPVRQLVLTLATDECDTTKEDDDGTRRLFIRESSNRQRALREALKQAGAKTIEVGATFAMKYTGDGERTKPGLNPPKLFVAQYKAPDPVAMVTDAFVGADELI